MTPVERQKLLLDRMKQFERVTYDTVINCGETQQFAFVYKGNPDEIEGYKIHCKSCTTVKRNGNILMATFKAPSCGDYLEHKQRGETQQSYTSNITVYFKDDQPLHKYNDDGELKENPDKVAVSLQIRTVIKF
jgi:hypothetical protein